MSTHPQGVPPRRRGRAGGRPRGGGGPPGPRLAWRSPPGTDPGDERRPVRAVQPLRRHRLQDRGDAGEVAVHPDHERPGVARQLRHRLRRDAREAPPREGDRLHRRPDRGGDGEGAHLQRAPRPDLPHSRHPRRGEVRPGQGHRGPGPPGGPAPRPARPRRHGGVVPPPERLRPRPGPDRAAVRRARADGPEGHEEGGRPPGLIRGARINKRTPYPGVMGTSLKIGITGLPGAGKTYALLKVIQRLEGGNLKVGGMITEPIIHGNRREGFYVVDWATKERRVFASKDIESKIMVGRYGGDITAPEEVGVQALRRGGP